MEPTAHAFVPAGFSWMNDPRTKPLQGAFTDALAALHRATGLDLAADANFVLTFVKRGAPCAGAVAAGPAPRHARVPRVRRARDRRGARAVAPRAGPARGAAEPNPFGRPR